MKALCIFRGDGTHPLSFLLKPGFKHVFVAIQHGSWWMIIDGAEGTTQTSITDIEDLSSWYREQGCTVLSVEGGKPMRALMITSCVGMAKAILGIRSWALTPWQLHEHLRKAK